MAPASDGSRRSACDIAEKYSITHVDPRAQAPFRIKLSKLLRSARQIF